MTLNLKEGNEFMELAPITAQFSCFQISTIKSHVRMKEKLKMSSNKEEQKALPHKGLNSNYTVASNNKTMVEKDTWTQEKTRTFQVARQKKAKIKSMNNQNCANICK